MAELAASMGVTPGWLMSVALGADAAREVFGAAAVPVSDGGDDHPRQVPPLRAGNELDLVIFDAPATRPRHVFRATWKNMLAYASRMVPEVTPAMRAHGDAMQTHPLIWHEAAFASRYRVTLAGLPSLLSVTDALVRFHEASGQGTR